MDSHHSCPAEDFYEDYTPCGRWRPGDPDLNTFDIIREFQLDQHETYYEGVTQVVGSSQLQTAYRLEKEANLTLRSVDAFPHGFPHQFSFECTFRTRQPPLVPWYLFHITDSYERSQLSVTIDPTRSSLQLALPDVDGNLQMATFEHTELFDESWHKVTIGVAQDQATLYVDCEPVQGIFGEYYTPLEPRGPVDATQGYLSVARQVARPISVPVSLALTLFHLPLATFHTQCVSSH